MCLSKADGILRLKTDPPWFAAGAQVHHGSRYHIGGVSAIAGGDAVTFVNLPFASRARIFAGSNFPVFGLKAGGSCRGPGESVGPVPRENFGASGPTPENGVPSTTLGGRRSASGITSRSSRMCNRDRGYVFMGRDTTSAEYRHRAKRLAPF